MEETSYKFFGDNRATEQASLVWRSFLRAMALDTKLPESILNMPGMSGRKYRSFINNLIGSMPSPRYLEIGSWAGSTACSAIFQNTLAAVCIDNWSEFGGPKDAFFANTKTVLGPNVDFKFIESDFRKVDFGSLGSPFNVYMFDGPHSAKDQFDGVLLAQPALERDFIMIVDDWNWPQVREGTIAALNQAGVKRMFILEIKTTQDDTHPTKAQLQDSEWHNGYFIAVCQKS
jgi:hypothetical protein